ncbi:mechanosensitive ion channel, partial [Escherichia coli]|nr:mechanosensitive ion channel [Escherichia coli]
FFFFKQKTGTGVFAFSVGRGVGKGTGASPVSVFRKPLAVNFSTITIMIGLSEIGVNIAPLLAGAGALGLAISFGSQTLVKDIITGVFIQFENGMRTGDLVAIWPLTGPEERVWMPCLGGPVASGADPHLSVVLNTTV